jgi:hypothetical protein
MKMAVLLELMEPLNDAIQAVHPGFMLIVHSDSHSKYYGVVAIKAYTSDKQMYHAKTHIDYHESYDRLKNYLVAAARWIADNNTLATVEELRGDRRDQGTVSNSTKGTSRSPERTTGISAQRFDLP